ncbi:MAG: hypothetical protein QHH74_15405 [Spirochaetota bacterium]|nr:hypothetical protein [Spirochaetota bacterium]
MKVLKSFLFIFISMFLLSCSEGKFWFQRNDPEPPYRLFDLLDDYPALYDAFSGIDQHTFNVLLADSINADVDAVKDVLPVVADPVVVDPLVDTIGALRSIVGRIIQQDDYEWPNDSYDSYATDLYSFLDDLSATSPGTTDEIVNILRKIIGYIQYAHGNELETVMADLIAFLQEDTSGQNLKDVFPLLQEGLGKLLVRANTYYDDTNNRLGNAALGMDALLSGINDIATGDPEAREALYDVIRETGNVMTTEVDGNSFAKILQKLMENLEDYATVGGYYYGDGIATTEYYADTTGVATGYYVNTELRNGIKSMWPALMMLFIRAKENVIDSPISDPQGRSVIECLSESLYNLKINCGIDFENYKLEPSLLRMVTYNGLGELRNSATYKVSYLDHLLYTLKLANEFGFLTRKVTASPYYDSNEPYQNNYLNNYTSDSGGLTARLHGLPTGGIMTVNDSLYPTCGGLKEARSASQNFTMWYLGAYNLSLDCRVTQNSWSGKTGGLVTSTTITSRGQGDYLFRSRNPFTSAQANNYKFYLGSDFPVLALLSGACAGDAGIPNGGRTGITPTNNNTSVGDANNDYRTYYPYVGNGLGELNTGRWTLGWIARACWEGEGPYYYADPNATTVVSGSKTYYVYYRPDGRIYAFVYKPSSNPSTWEYFYPSDGGNDADDPSGQTLVTDKGTFKLRENRYKAYWDTDHYMVRSTNINYHDDNNHAPTGWTGYYSPASVVTDGTDPLAKYKMHSLKGTTGRNQYSDDLDAYTSNSGAIRFYEKISEGDGSRACASQEEAMYRNFQWLVLEKKFVFIMPMTSYVYIKAVAAYMCNIDLYIDAPLFVIIEGNGLVGMATAKKTGAVGTWVFKGNQGFDIVRPQPNGVNYGDSFEPGDGRLWVIVKEDSSWKSLLGNTDGDYVGVDTIWDTILGNGNVLPNVIGDNIVTMARMAFLQKDYVASSSSDIGNESSSVWQNRNKLLPVVTALAGVLHGKSYYEKPLSGYWYNFAGNHKYPLKYLGDLISSLVSPVVRYYKTPYTGASKGWFVPQMENHHSRGTYAFFTPKPVDNNVDFKPRSQLRTIAQILTESTPNATAKVNGLIPALANTNIVSKLLAFLQKTGRNDSIYAYQNEDSSNYTDWGAKQKIFYGLEQIITTIKAAKSKELKSTYYIENVNYPTWMFTNDDGTLSMSDENHGTVNFNTALNELIGSSDTDTTPDAGEKGLAVFVDGRDDSNPDRNWNNYYKLMNGIAELMSNQGSTTGQYCITNDLISVIDKSLTSFQATDAQLKGLRHTLGALLYYYDGSQWVVPNELNDILTGYLPQILHGFAGHYNNLMTVANNMLVDDGFVEYFMTNLSSSYPSQQVLEELYAFLGTDLIANPDSRLWDDLGELLIAFASMMNDVEGSKYYKATTFEDLTRPSYSSPTEYLYSEEFDPYSGLGQVLTK